MAILMLDPTGTEERLNTSLATRDGMLSGKRLGLLANGKRNADVLLRLVGELLVERHGMLPPAFVDKGDASRPAADGVLGELLPRCDAVVTAIGD
jgi:hypothetical protein